MVGLLLIFFPSLPPIPCLSTAHVTSPRCYGNPPHVADRMRKKRGGDNNAEGKGRVGEEEMEEKKKMRNRGGRKMEQPRVKGENKAQNNI